MYLKIEFQDKNHNVISIHNIEYNTITPPYIRAYNYCKQIMHYYRCVMFFCVTNENQSINKTIIQNENKN